MIFVTGGSGFIGAALLAELGRTQREVRVLSRAPGKRFTQPTHGIQVVAGDLHDPSRLEVALHRVHTVIHLAGAVDAEPARLESVNVEGARNIASAARRCGARLFVHVSSAGVYGDAAGDAMRTEDAALAARSPYERSKREGENAVRKALREGPTALVVLRPSGVYGGAREATQVFLRDLVRRRLRVGFPPAVIVHPTYVDDLVQVIVGCIDRDDLNGETFNVGGDRALSLDDWAAAAAAALGVRLYRLAVPRRPVASLARGISTIARAAGLEPHDRLARLCYPVLSRALDTTRARQRLGFVPMPMDRALAQTIATARALGAL